MLALLKGQGRFVRVRTLRAMLVYQGTILRRALRPGPVEEILALQGDGFSIEEISAIIDAETFERALESLDLRTEAARAVENLDAAIAESCVLPLTAELQDVLSERRITSGAEQRLLTNLRVRGLLVPMIQATVRRGLRNQPRTAGSR